MTQVVLITGCSTGIGRAVAERLTVAGYTVVATARAVEALDDVPSGAKLAVDVTDAAAVQAAVAATLERYGRIDALVNNAGYAVRGAVEEVPEGAIRAMFDVNVFGVVRMVRAVAPVMREQGPVASSPLGQSPGSCPRRATDPTPPPSSPSRR